MSADRSIDAGDKAAPLRMLSRLGVASRLLLAFLGISGLAIVGAGVAIVAAPLDAPEFSQVLIDCLLMNGGLGVGELGKHGAQLILDAELGRTGFDGLD